MKTISRGWPALLIVDLVIGLGGCVVGPEYHPPAEAALNVPSDYTGATAPAPHIDLATWWAQFRDPLLTELIGRATADNLDIAVSEARLRQAREALIQTRSTLLPTVTGSAGETHTSSYARTTTVNGAISPGGSFASDGLSLGIDAAWQADLFGGLHRSVQSSRASAEAAGYDLVAVRTAVAGEVATNYIAARLAQARLAIARDTLRTQDDNLAIAGWRVRAGLVSSIDEQQALAQRAQTAASIPLLQTAFVNAANRLGVLTGQAPGAVRPMLDQQGSIPPGTIPRGPEGVAVGIPADTLRQRPDVRAAERALAAATAQIGVAKAQLYPALAITGNLNTAASHVGSLGDLIVGSVFAGLTQTIFDGGRLRSQVRSARAGADLSFATYKQTVLQGLEDVENAMQALSSAKARQDQLAIASDASNNAAIFARSQYRGGLIDFLTLLQTEQALLSARDALAVARSDQATALVQLYLALGGGWQVDAAPPFEGRQ